MADPVMVRLLAVLALLLPGAAGASGEGSAPVIRALLAPRDETTLSSRMDGPITNLDVKEGDAFAQGQRLAAFDCTIPEGQHRRARAVLSGAQQTHAANLKMKKYGSVSDVEVGVSGAEVAKAEAELGLTAAGIDHCRILAPFAGRVVKRHVNPHQYVAEGEKLLEILDDSQLVLNLLVPSRWLRWLKPEATFTVAIEETGGHYPARVVALGARVDPVSQSLPVRAELTGQFPELLAGMSGTAQFPAPPQ